MTTLSHFEFLQSSNPSKLAVDILDTSSACDNGQRYEVMLRSDWAFDPVEPNPLTAAFFQSENPPYPSIISYILENNRHHDRGNPHGPPLIRRISAVLSKRLTTWQTLVVSLLWLYVARNFGKLVGLESPEPLANLYARSYFRATWITTALDAGFWSAMRIRRKRIRDICSIIFSFYYLICAEQADEKVRKVRGTLTLDHLRVSWDKGSSPYLSLATKIMRPRFMRYQPRAIRIPRPQESSYKEPVHAWLYFDGPLSALKMHNKVILDVPGGGFVAMDPRKHDDKLLAWAGKCGLPVLSLDYKKAPEYPYPYALNECYDVYHTIIASHGRCMGLSGEARPQIVLSGDSAGGNLAVGLVLMILQSGSTDSRRWRGEDMLPLPEGIVLIYPALDMNIGNWMSDEQMALIRDRKARKTNRGVLDRKSDDYRKLTPSTPHPSDDELDNPNPSPPHHARSSSGQGILGGPILESPRTPVHSTASHNTGESSMITSQAGQPPALKTRLAMSSMISYFNDRVLTPEMMRAMIILYIGPYNRPDFATDFLLSPVMAPDVLLSRWPKTYFLTGERDPLVDDTVVFAGRIRQAKAARLLERKELGLEKSSVEFVGSDYVEVMLVPGISHGFLQFVSVFPEGWKYIFQCGKWFEEIFAASDAAAANEYDAESEYADVDGERQRHHRRTRTESSGDEDRPLEMSIGGSPGQGSSPGRGPAGRGRRFKSSRPRRGERPKSLVSLASEDDLLGRRMKGLAMSLGGNGEIPVTP